MEDTSAVAKAIIDEIVKTYNAKALKSFLVSVLGQNLLGDLSEDEIWLNETSVKLINASKLNLLTKISE